MVNDGSSVFLPPVEVDAGALLDPSRALDAAKDLARALNRDVNLTTIVRNYKIVYCITNVAGGLCRVVNVTIENTEIASLL